MSHLIKAKMKVNSGNLAHFIEAVRCAGGTYHGRGTAQIYSQTRTGELFSLPGWNYKLCVTDDGELVYDNYQGNWGNQSTLDKVIQDCVRKTITAAARKHGFKETKTAQDEDGRLVVTLACYE